MMKKTDGFTLMEVLVSLMILAIIGAMMMRGLQSAIRSQQRINENSLQLTALQEAMTIFARDVKEIINRPIFNTDGSLLPAVVSQANYLEFTKTGLVNPLGRYKRSSLQRIAYQCQDGALIKYVWLSLDRGAGNKKDSYRLLTDVSDCQFQLHQNPIKQQQQQQQQQQAQQGQQTSANPTQSAGKDQPPSQSWAAISARNKFPPLPDAVQFSFTMKGIGSVTRFIALPG